MANPPVHRIESEPTPQRNPLESASPSIGISGSSAEASDTGEDGLGGFNPDERVRIGVGVVDVAVDRGFEIVGVFEGTASARSLADHGPRLDVEGGEQVDSALAAIVVGPALWLAGLHRQHGAVLISAWICGLSSTHSTTARCGGAMYRPDHVSDPKALIAWGTNVTTDYQRRGGRLV
jgi:hypothetical protein